MTSGRDELFRPVQELPEHHVPAALAAIRHLTPRASSWPPAFFGGAAGDGESIAETADDLLERGFGRYSNA